MNPPTYPMRPVNGGPLSSPVNASRYKREINKWRFEPKFNGWRIMFDDRDGRTFNRHGQRSHLSYEFRNPLAAMANCGGVFPWWDAEGLERRHGIGKGSLILLDWIPVPDCADVLPSNVTSADDYMRRRSVIEAWGNPFDWRDTPFSMKTGALYFVPSLTYDEAVEFNEAAPIINEMLGCVFYEGVVAKRIDSPYNIQLRSDSEESPAWIKHRFTTL